MAVFNAAKREIDIKIVYYGPALCGKTTNVQCVHKMLAPNQRGDIMSLATKDDRTLFFDFLPIELGDVKGFKTRFHVYTVPGQVYYALTRRAVLTGVDGVVFVADSQASKMEENIESLQDLNENLNYYKKDLSSIPFIMQYNKRDLDNILPVAELNEKINTDNVPYFAASAVDGTGVIETLTACCKLVLKQMDSSGGAKKRRRQRPEEPAAPPPTAPKPSTPEPAAAPKPPAPAAYSFEDDNEPVIKIIAEDDFSLPDVPPAPSPDFAADTSAKAPSADLDFSAGIDIGLPDDGLQTNAGGPTDFSLDEVPGMPSDDDSIPALDALDSSGGPSLSLDDATPAVNLDDSRYDLPSFDDDVTTVLDKEPTHAPPPPPEPAPPPASAPRREQAQQGVFTVDTCGTPQKISATGVRVPVTLKNSRTGQTCSLAVTLSFEDVSA